MAKLITKFKYLKPNVRQSVGGYAKYIATREGVERIDESYKLAQSSIKQQQLIQKILRDFPDSKETLEYEDYQKEPTVGNASEFITRALEDNAYEVMQTKNYADYIATRPRVQRFGTHGLFTDDGVEVKLKEVSDGLNQYGGNVWTVIISLRREDAERLGYNNGERWRDMLRTQTEALAKNFKIPMEHLKWYAAFHNESHHPHVHLMVYADGGAKPYLSRQGVMNLRSSFANDIFAQDLLCVYEKQTEHRNELKVQSREVIGEIISKINTGVYENPKLEEMLLQLAGRLSKTKGKKVYGYLKPDVKAIINRIVDELAKDERIAALYDLWYEQKEEILKTYTQEMPGRIPLADNPEFKSIKNAVIQEAMNIVADRVEIEDTAEEPPTDGDDLEMELEIDADVFADDPTELDTEDETFSYGGRRSKKPTWWTDGYKQARNCLYGTKDMPPDFVSALIFMQAEADIGNGFAMHDLGRMYLSGLGCEKDEEQAQEWFAKAYRAFVEEEARAVKKDYLQYRIGKLFSLGYGVGQDYEKAAAWYEKAVAENNSFAAYSLGSLYQRGQGVEQEDAKAFQLYMMAAEHIEKPNAYAAYELGRMCRDGTGTDVDREASENWYKQAYKGFLKIERNLADDKLYYRLGQMNLTGTGTEVNIPQAKKYFEKAAELENPDALYGLGRLYLKKDSPDYDPQKAVKYLLEAAKRGHEYAQYTLGKLFLKGDDVPKNTAYALRWLEEAAGRENQYAEYLLGKTYLKSEDVEADLFRAKEMLRCSSAQGNPYAQYTLGKTLLEGTLLPQDIPEAIHLLAESASQEYAPACYLLGKLFYQGELLPQDLQKAIHYLEKATVQGNLYAACLAGKILLTEEPVKDVLRAIRYFEAAAENGNGFAEYQLGRLYLYGKEVERDYEKAASYLALAAGHGNQYAAQLLHSLQSNRNWSAAVGTLRLIKHISHAIQNRLEDEKRGREGAIDRKLRRKINEKKQAQGLHPTE